MRLKASPALKGLNTNTNQGLTRSNAETEILKQNQMASVVKINVYTYFEVSLLHPVT